MNAGKLRDKASTWHAEDFGGIEVIRARYVTQSFAKHTHDTLSIGVVKSGANAFLCRGETHVAPAGTICVVNPGEVHTGDSGKYGGWSYWNFYPQPDQLRELATEIAGSTTDVPFFQESVIRDARAVQLLMAMFESLEGPTTRLERQTRLCQALSYLILHHTDDSPNPRTVGNEPIAIRQAREYLEAHATNNVSLTDLASVVDLSPYHLVRTFRTAIGLPPHAYQIQCRLRQAKARLLEGIPIVQVAHDTGFADQAHLTRCFKRVFGITPGSMQRDSKNIQDNAMSLQ